MSHGAIAGCSAPGGTAIVNCDASGTVYNLPFNKGTPAINTAATTSSNYFDDVLVYSATNLTDCSGTVTWGGNCSATIDASTALPLGQTITKTISTPQNTGTATISCTLKGTVPTPTLSATGNCDCNAGQTLSWGTGSNQCSATTTTKRSSTATNDATNATNTDEALTTTTPAGTATARCVNGAMVVANGTTPTCGTNSCHGGVISWGPIDASAPVGFVDYFVVYGAGGPCTGITDTPTNGTITAGGPVIPSSWAEELSQGGSGYNGTAKGVAAVQCHNGILEWKYIYCRIGTWVAGTCSATVCGVQGTTAAPVCKNAAGVTLLDMWCDPALKPAAGQSCNKQGCAVNGACNSSTVGACSAGTQAGLNYNYTNTTGGSNCGGTATWTCVGSNGGSTASCTAANPNTACPTGPCPSSCIIGTDRTGAGYRYFCMAPDGSMKTYIALGANGGQTALEKTVVYNIAKSQGCTNPLN